MVKDESKGGREVGSEGGGADMKGRGRVGEIQARRERECW